MINQKVSNLSIKKIDRYMGFKTSLCLLRLLLIFQNTTLDPATDYGGICEFPFRFLGVLYYACTNIDVVIWNFILRSLFIRMQGTVTSCKGQLVNQIFKTGFEVAWEGFLSYYSHQLVKFLEEKRFRL